MTHIAVVGYNEIAVPKLVHLQRPGISVRLSAAALFTWPSSFVLHIHRNHLVQAVQKNLDKPTIIDTQA